MAVPEFVFEEAVKHESKARVAIVGPSGSGKTMTSLILARELVGPTGRIAGVDTEHGSMEKYADIFKFSHVKLNSFSADNFFGCLYSAEKQGFGVVIFDSMSHFWMGKDGALEYVEERTKVAKGRGGDQMTGWKDWSPTERAMVDAMLSSPIHVIVTMRTKTEYKEEEFIKDGQKKTKRVKVGLMPVQRAGLEYEFDLVGYMDDESVFLADKTRCSPYREKPLKMPQGKDFAAFKKWLEGEKAKEIVNADPADIPALKPVIDAPAGPVAVAKKADKPQPTSGGLDLTPGPQLSREDVYLADMRKRMADSKACGAELTRIKGEFMHIDNGDVQYADIKRKHGLLSGDGEKKVYPKDDLFNAAIEAQQLLFRLAAAARKASVTEPVADDKDTWIPSKEEIQAQATQ